MPCFHQLLLKIMSHPDWCNIWESPFSSDFKNEKKKIGNFFLFIFKI